MSERHLSVEELAEREGVQVWTVYGWNKRGTGPRYIKTGEGGGGRVRYKLADVIAWENTRYVDRAGDAA